MSTHRNFKGQMESEVVLCFFRKHWIDVLPSLLILPFLFVLLVGLIMSFSALHGTPRAVQAFLLIGYLAVLFFIHRQFMAIFYYLLRTVMITNYRIVEIDRSVFFRDSKDSIDLSKIQDIKKIQNGILENILNFGTLRIVLSGTHISANITSVPRPDYQFKKINAVKQQFLHSEHGFRALPREAPADEPVMVEDIV